MKQGAAGIQPSDRPVFLRAVIWSAGLLVLFVTATSLSQVAFDLLVAPLNAALADKMPGQVIFTSPSRYCAMKSGLGAFGT
ncbi:hypothetical protein, partial [Parvibaculum sp.]|uniref:hypothetical protein n=1 Tax=Parvibaculum sp. TaxID=2024848 RepID=UPI0032EE249A